MSVSKQHQSFDWQYKIAKVDIEQKEKEFMGDEFEYYKSTKTKSRKKFVKTRRNKVAEILH